MFNFITIYMCYAHILPISTVPFMYIFNLGEIAGRCAYFITLSDTPKAKEKETTKTKHFVVKPM